MDHLKSFVIGSSFLVFVHFFLSVQKIPPSLRNYSFEFYSLIAPLYLGLMNMLGGILFRGPNRYLYTGLFSGCVIAMVATLSQSYNFSQRRWIEYYIYIIFKHFVTFFLVIQTITKLIGG